MSSGIVRISPQSKPVAGAQSWLPGERGQMSDYWQYWDTYQVGRCRPSISDIGCREQTGLSQSLHAHVHMHSEWVHCHHYRLVLLELSKLRLESLVRPLSHLPLLSRFFVPCTNLQPLLQYSYCHVSTKVNETEAWLLQDDDLYNTKVKQRRVLSFCVMTILTNSTWLAQERRRYRRTYLLAS